MERVSQSEGLYDGRPMSGSHPEIGLRELDTKLSEPVDDGDSRERFVRYISRAIDLERMPATAAVIGCGPQPVTMRDMAAVGWLTVGVEPVECFTESARGFLEGSGQQVLMGSAEELPLESDSVTLVMLENVLEHVDSPQKALAEAYRVTAPGGALYVHTTNRQKVGNSEYTKRFLNWYPPLVRESFVHQHLHFDPTLARYSSRPAVHWFSYADLCALGREAGFYRFYSRLDLLRPEDVRGKARPLKAALLDGVRTHPWLRSAALTQRGGTVLMLKRGR